MPLPLIPIAVISLAGLAFGANKVRQPKAPSAQDIANRAVIFDTALNTCKDPDKLRALGDAFEKQGCSAEAVMLYKRAALIEAPAEVKAQRREILDAAMKSTKVEGIATVADAFEELGATAAAAKLRARIEDLKQSA